MRRIESHEPERSSESIPKPLRGRLALVVRHAGVPPHDDIARLASQVERHIDGAVTRDRQPQPRSVNVGLDQREPRLFPLRHEAAVRSDDHPLPVVLESGGRDCSLRALDAAAGLHRVDMQGCDADHDADHTVLDLRH